MGPRCDEAPGGALCLPQAHSGVSRTSHLSKRPGHATQTAPAVKHIF